MVTILVLITSLVETENFIAQGTSTADIEKYVKVNLKTHRETK